MCWWQTTSRGDRSESSQGSIGRHQKLYESSLAFFSEMTISGSVETCMVNLIPRIVRVA